MAEILARHARWLWVREQGPDGPRERPVYLDPRLERQIEGYFALMEDRPDAFSPSELYPICTDRRQLLEFEEKTGRPAGLVFDNLPYYQTVADLHLAEREIRNGRKMAEMGLQRMADGVAIAHDALCGSYDKLSQLWYTSVPHPP